MTGISTMPPLRYFHCIPESVDLSDRRYDGYVPKVHECSLPRRKWHCSNDVPHQEEVDPLACVTLRPNGKGEIAGNVLLQYH